MRPKKICEYAAPADPRTEKRPACAMVRRSLLRAAVVAACVAPGAADLTITITSPVAGHASKEKRAAGIAMVYAWCSVRKCASSAVAKHTPKPVMKWQSNTRE